ncbi:MAG: hemerythrin domain-containing protein [Candidatus Melainabacteria bacterium]|nr:hemerythrin domain-containing protein [Candidatus Melainabacteria bacterium]
MISKCLSLEHQNVQALLERFKNFLQAHSITQQPDWTSHDAARIVADLKCALESNIPNHFAIEEQELFPIMVQEGYGDLIEVLLEDHKIIVELIEQIRPVVLKIFSSSVPLPQSNWEMFYRQGNALITELPAHAAKEDAGLMPALEECLDEVQAQEIYNHYQLLKLGKTCHT